MEGVVYLRQASPSHSSSEYESAEDSAESDDQSEYSDQDRVSEVGLPDGFIDFRDWPPYTWGALGTEDGLRLSEDTDDEDLYAEEEAKKEIPFYNTYCLSNYPTDDLDRLASTGCTPRGLEMPPHLTTPPRPTTCFFELRESSHLRKLYSGARNHMYCNCVKCTAVLERTATFEEWQAWHEARARWMTRSKGNRARYLEGQVDELAYKLQLKMKRERMVVAMALDLSPEEIQDWDDKGKWDERARERTLKDFPHLRYETTAL